VLPQHLESPLAFIIQLSDIHLHHSKPNPVLDRAARIVDAIRGIEPGRARQCVLLVTGDVAFSGKPEEYRLASDFLAGLRQRLESETDNPVEVILIPGNHDCDFAFDSKARGLLRDASLNCGDADASVVDIATNVQSAFFEFRSTFAKGACPQGLERLFQTVEIPVAGGRLYVNAYNTAWLSTLSEKPGELFMPVTRLTPPDQRDGLVVSVFHHPYGWLEPNNARDFRNLALPEVKVRVEGEAIRILPLPPYESRVWVREAMLLAGYAAAHLALREGLPFPFATQEAPTRRVEGESLSALWEQRKAMKRAQLKAVPAPHKGLGLPLYAQVTSPLRRYLDLVAHQQLRAWLKSERPLTQAEVLERVGAAEAVADWVREAERKSKLHCTLLYLQERGYEGPGVLVERRGGQGVFLLPELGLTAQVALPSPLPLDTEVRLRFLEADLTALEARFALL
jgi:hypothetical protein